MQQSSRFRAGVALVGATSLAAGATFAVAPRVGVASARRIATAAVAAPVSVRVQGLRRTLLAPTSVRLRAGSVARFGAPPGACPATSAQGALDQATHGRWQGSWSSQYSEYFITRILGDRQPGAPDFWSLYVNGRAATAGACDTAARPGDTILFAAVPSRGRPPLPIEISLPARARVGQSVRVRTAYYTASGTRRALAGARVRLDGRTLHSGADGRTHALTLDASGTLTATATKRGFVAGVALITVSG